MKFTILIPTYRTQVNVVLKSSEKKLKKEEQKVLNHFDAISEGFGTVRGRAYGIYIDDEGYRTATIILNKDKLGVDALSHECLHATFYILRYVDIPHDEVSEEAYTCLMEYMFTSCYNEIFK